MYGMPAVPSEPFLPWQSDFGRTVMTDVVLTSESDELRVLLRSVILYETVKGNAMVLRVEVLHLRPASDALDIAAAAEGSADPREVMRRFRDRITLSVNGQEARWLGSSDDGFRSVGECWVTAPEGEFAVSVSYAGTSAVARLMT